MNICVYLFIYIYCYFSQLKVLGSDQGSPERKEEVTVQVNIRRDQYLPQFEGDFERSIDVNHPVNNTPVVIVKATDRDKVVSSYII